MIGFLTMAPTAWMIRRRSDIDLKVLPLERAVAELRILRDTRRR